MADAEHTGDLDLIEQVLDRVPCSRRDTALRDLVATLLLSNGVPEWAVFWATWDELEAHGRQWRLHLRDDGSDPVDVVLPATDLIDLYFVAYTAGLGTLPSPDDPIVCGDNAQGDVGWGRQPSVEEVKGLAALIG